LSSVARAPGEGRTNVVNYLENRQAGKDGESRTLLVKVLKRRKRPLKLSADLLKPATKPQTKNTAR